MKGISGVQVTKNMKCDHKSSMSNFVNETIANFDNDSAESGQKQFHLRSGSINFDKGCLSCRGEPAHTMKLFKMACLSYKPSPVDYRESTMSRKGLI